MSQSGRRQFLVASGALLVSHLTHGQSELHLRQIGFLQDTKPSKKGRGPREWMRKGLQERGWVEGRNFVYEFRFAEGTAKRYPGFAEELVRLPVDVIIAPSEDAALAARAATRTIPIVMIYPLDPVRLGLIDSYAHPGGNVTGLCYEAAWGRWFEKQLDLIRQTVPGLARIAVLFNSSSPQSERWLEEMRDAARTLHLYLLPVAAQSPEEFGPAFVRISEQHAEALLIFADPMFYLHRAQLAEMALRHRLPTSSVLYKFPQAGGLMSYEVDIPNLYARATDYIDKIFRGANPAELPVEQPTKFRLTLNLRTAKAIGISIPPAIMLRADQVIE
jgi:ABC-type uncharacterized transport system substrate-binding protein